MNRLPDIEDLETMETEELLALVASIKAEFSAFDRIEKVAGKIVRDRLLDEYTQDGVMHPGVPGMKISYSPGGNESRKVNTKAVLAAAESDPEIMERFVSTGETSPSIRLLFDMEYVP